MRGGADMGMYPDPGNTGFQLVRRGAAQMTGGSRRPLGSVVRFACISCMEEFNEIQELASGTGYTDIVYLPKKNSSMPVFII